MRSAEKIVAFYYLIYNVRTEQSSLHVPPIFRWITYSGAAGAAPAQSDAVATYLEGNLEAAAAHPERHGVHVDGRTPRRVCCHFRRLLGLRKVYQKLRGSLVLEQRDLDVHLGHHVTADTRTEGWVLHGWDGGTVERDGGFSPDRKQARVCFVEYSE